MVSFGRQIEGFALNDRSVIMWSDSQVMVLDLSSMFGDPQDFKIMTLGLDFTTESNVGARNKTKIRNVKVGSTVDKILILTSDELSDQHRAVYWDVERDQEINAFDVSKHAKIIWDFQGSPYIVERDSVTFTDQGIKLS